MSSGDTEFDHDVISDPEDPVKIQYFFKRVVLGHLRGFINQSLFRGGCCQYLNCGFPRITGPGNTGQTHRYKTGHIFSINTIEESKEIFYDDTNRSDFYRTLRCSVRRRRCGYLCLELTDYVLSFFGQKR